MESSKSTEENNEKDQNNAARITKVNAQDSEGSSISDSDSSDSDVDFYCDDCDMHFSGIKPLKQHQKSGKHIKNLKKKKLQQKIDNDLQNDENSDEDDFVLRKNSYALCETCDMEFSGPEPYIQHLQSKGHKKKCKEKKILDQVKVGDSIDEEKLKQVVKDATYSQSKAKDLAAKNIWACEACSKNFSGMEPFVDHMNSKSHERILQQKSMKQKLEDESSDISYLDSVEDILICGLCHMSFSGPESAFDHLKSRGHAKKIEIQAWKDEQRKSKSQVDEKVSENSNESKNPDESETATKCQEGSNKTGMSILDRLKADEEAGSEDNNKNTSEKAYIQGRKEVEKDKSQESSKKMGATAIFASCLVPKK